MKKILFVFFIAFCFAQTIKAQGNLQFNRVVRLSYLDSIIISPITVGTITIPANKIWKIESGSVLVNSSLFPSVLSLLVDGQLMFCGSYPVSGYMPYSGPPMWLSAGSYNISIGVGNGSNMGIIAKLSAIEYNIVP
jgi:hypothetical protein